MVRLFVFVCLAAIFMLKAKCDLKSSLTFVIDDTGSMTDDIQAVLEGVNAIFDTVTNSNASQIEDFVLVTFNDPGFRHRVTTRNKEEFKNALANIYVDGGGDCPEMSISGTEEALHHSRQGSLLYVFTDASSNDARKYEDVKNLAQKKQVQIVYGLTGDCGISGNKQIYYDLAKDTSGQVFHLDRSRNEVAKLLKYVKNQISSRKELIKALEFPPGTHNFQYMVDSKMKELEISVSGTNPTIAVTDPEGFEASTEDIIRTDNVAIVKVTEVKTGVYLTEVTSSSATSVKVTAETAVHFQHGFSQHEAASLNETATRPIRGLRNRLSIKLTTEGNDEIILDAAQLLDLENNVIIEKALTISDLKDQFYTSNAFYPPDHTFRVAIKGHDENGKDIFRMSLTPMEPQNIEARVLNKKPTVKVLKDEKKGVEYGQPLQLKCKVHGYPTPQVIWEDNHEVKINSELSLVEIPYDYLSVLTIDKVIENNTYTCKARNEHGEDSDKANVNVFATYFNILKKPNDVAAKISTSITVECKIYAKPPAKIRWYKNNKRITADGNIQISSDNSSLTLTRMLPRYVGKYTCLAENDIVTKTFDFRVQLFGAEHPKIDKTVKEVFAKKGTNIDLSCKVFHGNPKSKIRWFFKHIGESEFNHLPGVNNNQTIHLTNVEDDHFGAFRCIAYNVIGRDRHTIQLILEYPPVIENNAEIVNLVAKVGDTVKIGCKSDGEPNPTIKWLLNGEDIIPASKYLSGYFDSDLMFKAEMNDSGIYVCQAINKHGTATKTFNLNIVGPATIKPPVESVYLAKVGDSLTLECEAEGNPTPSISWIYRDIQFKNERLQKETRRQLHFRRIQVYEQGYYTCIASNIGGTANVTFQIKVYAPPIIENVYPEKTFFAVVGDLALRIPCNATGNPKPDISWIKDGVDRIATGTEWYDQDEDGALVIKNVDKISAGMYICEAENILGFDNETYEVIVEAYPRPGSPTKTILIKEGDSDVLKCDVPHQRTDHVRWYKDGILLSNSPEHHLVSAQQTDSGMYTCRVSNFVKSRSGNVKVKVGFAPHFVSEETLNITFEKHASAVMACEAGGYPKPEISWWHNGNHLSVKSFIHVFEMNDYNDRGNYFCLVKNEFGSIVRRFSISSKECLLNIKSDFQGNAPLVLNSFNSWPIYETISKYLVIPSGDTLELHCPKGFHKFDKEEVQATCENESNFIFGGNSYTFSNFKCKEELKPEIQITGQPCEPSNANSVNVKVGYKVEHGRRFVEVFSVCVDTTTRATLYAKHQVHYSLAGFDSAEVLKPYTTDIVPFDLDEMYDCGLQLNTTSSVLGRWFHKDDGCCFRRRQLVNPKDVLPGVPQKATYHVLNMVPHWSTCNSQNWDIVERRVRKLAQSTNMELDVWTGVSEQKLKIEGHSISLYDKNSREQAVAKYIWKVVQDPSTKESLAIIQLNIPDLTLSEAYANMPCRDICNEVLWMRSRRWRDVTKGYTFCCSISDFERAFGYNGIFNGSGKVLYDVKLLHSSSLT